MTSETVINEEGKTISSPVDNTIEGINMGHNRKIAHLPSSPFEIFPKLFIYSAWGCQLKTVKFKHFKGLKNLRILLLANNQIRIIPSDSFKNLGALNEVYLSKFHLITVTHTPSPPYFLI
jgi:Leucine-rich repeat (LRR) protein